MSALPGAPTDPTLEQELVELMMDAAGRDEARQIADSRFEDEMERDYVEYLLELESRDYESRFGVKR
jgi:hypothetical protein